MGATANKESRLNIRCNTHARALLDLAASYAHQSVSEFVLSHALASAEKVVQQQESITLKPEDLAAFLAMLDAPAAPNAALQEALRQRNARVVLWTECAFARWINPLRQPVSTVGSPLWCRLPNSPT
ncbi:MAG: DUF1778 domain-containing protein [Rhodoferax sp.]|nr:DUF1778 domain-containing protein [Rhodoferax sp.]